MSIFETLGELIGKALRTLFDSISGLLRFKAEQLEDINKEIAGASLDPEKFKTQEVKELARKIKESLKSSPEGIADWAQGIAGDFMATIWDKAMGIMLPSKMETFEEAKAAATWLTSLMADFIVLSAVLDMVGTALSATLVRNLVHVFQLFASTFGLDRYLTAVIAPALSTSIIPRLEQGYNAQYQTLIPGASDLIRMAVREAFSPEIAERFGQYEDFPEEIVPWLEKSGLSREWATRHWATHWDLPSTTQGIEMLRRGVIDEDTLKLLLRALDVMPYWRDKLINIFWEVPTRVDVRRFWEMRTINEARLREVYTAIGYHGKDLEDYVLWTKIYVDFPDLMTRYKNGWLTLDDVRSELVKLGMSAERAEELIQTKVKAAASEKLVKDKDLTAAEIVKGVKKEVITWDQGLELLQDLGYDLWEAEFKLAIEVAVLAGSPESYSEFKDLTEKWRKAVMPTAPGMPDEIKKLADQVVKLTKDVEALEQSIAEAKKGLLDTEVLPEEATKKVRKLQTARNRAIAELSRVKAGYERLIAEWKHTV